MSMLARKRRPFLATALAVLCLVLSLAAFAPAARGGVCEAALAACMVDAALTLATSPMAGVSFMLFCLDGYSFCLQYY